MIAVVEVPETFGLSWRPISQAVASVNTTKVSGIVATVKKSPRGWVNRATTTAATAKHVR